MVLVNEIFQRLPLEEKKKINELREKKLREESRFAKRQGTHGMWESDDPGVQQSEQLADAADEISIITRDIASGDYWEALQAYWEDTGNNDYPVPSELSGYGKY